MSSHIGAHNSHNGAASGHVAQELHDIYQRLKDLERALTVLQMGLLDGPVTRKDVEPYETMLNKIAFKQEDAAFKVDGKIPAGQAILSHLMNRCYTLLELIKSHCDQQEADRTHERRAMHNAFLHQQQRALHATTGAFGAVDVALQDIKARLEHVNRRLAHYLTLEPASYKMQDLQPLEDELLAIDAQREDNAFKVHGTIPAGQAVLHALLNQCFVMMELARNRTLV